MTTRKLIGNKTEQNVAKILQETGYWVHIMGYTLTGQPCDIVAISEKQSMLLDAKHCDKPIFSFDRIEENQINCFLYATCCGVKVCGFAIEYDSIIYFLSFNKYLSEKEISNKNSIDVRSLPPLKSIL